MTQGLYVVSAAASLALRLIRQSKNNITIIVVDSTIYSVVRARLVCSSLSGRARLALLFL